MVYLSAIGFAFTVMPVHLFNYVYINSEKKYASLNVCAFRFLRFYNANTVENKPGEMQVNGKNKKLNPAKIRFNAYRIFNSLCIYKIVQLGDFGLAKDANSDIALVQNALTVAIYKFIQINGNYAKLRNYTILNEEHGFVRYYCKFVTIINGIVIGKIILYLILEQLNAHKT